MTEINDWFDVLTWFYHHQWSSASLSLRIRCVLSALTTVFTYWQHQESSTSCSSGARSRPTSAWSPAVCPPFAPCSAASPSKVSWTAPAPSGASDRGVVVDIGPTGARPSPRPNSGYQSAAAGGIMFRLIIQHFARGTAIVRFRRSRYTSGVLEVGKEGPSLLNMMLRESQLEMTTCGIC